MVLITYAFLGEIDVDWILQNKEWIFSGIAVPLVGAIGFLVKKAMDKKEKEQVRQIIRSGDNSYNIQGGKDVNVTIGDKDVRG